MKKWDLSNIAIIFGILSWTIYYSGFMNDWSQRLSINTQTVIAISFIISIVIVVGSIILNIILLAKKDNISEIVTFKLIVGLVLNIPYVIAYYSKISILFKL